MMTSRGNIYYYDLVVLADDAATSRDHKSSESRSRPRIMSAVSSLLKGPMDLGEPRDIDVGIQVHSRPILMNMSIRRLPLYPVVPVCRGGIAETLVADSSFFWCGQSTRISSRRDPCIKKAECCRVYLVQILRKPKLVGGNLGLDATARRQ